jgi:sortase (surface protein transpeptidase)
MKTRSPFPPLLLALLGLALGIGLVIASVIVFANTGNPTLGDVEGVEQSLSSPSSITPSSSTTTSEPVETAEARTRPLWQVNKGAGLTETDDPMRMPTGLRIEAIGVAAEIRPYGVDRATGQMDVPDNVVDVGWYQYGSSPGEPGSAVLAAHVDLAGQGPGVFFDLHRLEPGDLIGVQFDDGSAITFSVQAVATYLKPELPSEVIFSRTGPPVLTLVTCGGAFDSSISRYDSNVVVYASPRADRPRDLVEGRNT